MTRKERRWQQDLAEQEVEVAVEDDQEKDEEEIKDEDAVMEIKEEDAVMAKGRT